MHPSAVAALACPHCGGPLSSLDAGGLPVLGCAAGHRHDVARQGYVALLGPRSRIDTGDSADMVAARAEFLGAGHYAPIAAVVAAAAAGLPGGYQPAVVLEIGAGTGYYLSAVLGAGMLDAGAPEAAVEPAGIALDASKFAARRAAADPRVASVLADAWSALPVLTGSADRVISVFAPRSAAEVSRVLAPGGRFVAVTPEPGHLAEIRQALGLLTVDDGKPERLAATFDGLLDLVSRRRLTFPITLTAADLSALVRMGPAARHQDLAEMAARVAAMPVPQQVTVSVTVSVLARS